MDHLKIRLFPMNRRRRIYEGKAKVLYEGPEPGTLVQHFKDDATAFNAKKHEVIDGKGVLNNRISEYIFQNLNDIGVPTHFIRRLNMREQLIREVEIIPLEVVVRNVAAGSLSPAARHRGRLAAAALDHRILLQERRAQRSDGFGRAHHRLRLGDAAGNRRHHGAGDSRQRFPDRPVPRRRHPPRRFQDGMRQAVGRRHDAHRRRRRNFPGFVPVVGHQVQRQARQGPFPPRSRRPGRSLFRSRAPARHHAGRREAAYPAAPSWSSDPLASARRLRRRKVPP